MDFKNKVPTGEIMCHLNTISVHCARGRQDNTPVSNDPACEAITIQCDMDLCDRLIGGAHLSSCQVNDSTDYTESCDTIKRIQYNYP